MVHISEIQARLSQLGITLSRWYQAELRELQHVLFEHEKIISIVPGRYFAGYALLVATDQRLLLIDKRTFFLTVDDIRYDMISETDFNSRLMDSTLHIYTLNKQHRFTSMKYRRHLRELTKYVQQRVMQLRYSSPNDDNRGRYAHVSAFMPSASHLHPVESTPQPVVSLPPLMVPKIIGGAAINGANRGYTPRMAHVSQMYTGPALLSGLIRR